MSTVPISLTVNGRAVQADIDPRTLLVQLIRDQLHLTGTHVGCDTAQCGCCTVHLDGQAVKSCSILAVQAQGKQVTTIEGISQGETLHPVQQAFRECHGLQCGYCTPGMLISSQALLNTTPNPSEEQIRDAIGGNLCRCTGYRQIVDAVKLAAARLAAGKK